MESRTDHLSLVDQIDQYLPQTQCTKCGYPRCRDYAQAIFDKETDINRCPPGGDSTINALARLFDKEEKALADDCDEHLGRHFARIQEENCIGCTLCIKPCPTDAIIGAAKHMHSVLKRDCTGCRICLDYCPVDCIEMVEYPKQTPGTFWVEYRNDEVFRWRNLTERRLDRRANSHTQEKIASSPTELRSEIRKAVNRERLKRWKLERRNSVRQKANDSTR